VLALLGSYMTAVFTGRVGYLSFLERPVYRLLGTDKDAEQSWKGYAGSMVASRRLAALRLLILTLQGHLPFNPQHFGDVTPALAFKRGELSHQHELAELRRRDDHVVLLPVFGLEFHQFISAAVGLALAVAVIRGFATVASPRSELLGGHDAGVPLHPVPFAFVSASSSSPRVRSTP